MDTDKVTGYAVSQAYLGQRPRDVFKPTVQLGYPSEIQLEHLFLSPLYHALPCFLNHFIGGSTYYGECLAQDLCHLGWWSVHRTRCKHLVVILLDVN
jgi:hypothetical protein